MSDRAEHFRPLFRTICLAVVSACGGDNPLLPPPPTSGMSTILVTLHTTGTNPDSNGYRVAVDQGASHAIAASESASLTLTVTPGSHRIELTDVAAHCVVSGGNPRMVATSALGTTGVTFRVNCPHVATLKIRTSTSGPSPDLDGYRLSIDGTAKGSLGPQDSISLGSLQPAMYRVRLSSVAGNCSVVGGSSRAVQLEDGEVETLDMPVTCVPRLEDPPGETLVVSSRNIQEEDFNLYLLPLQGGVRQRLTDNPGDEGLPEFSPAADRILYLQSTVNSSPSLRVLDRITRQESLFPSQGADRAVWSADGTRMAFTRGGRIYRVNRDGTGEFPLTGNFDDRDPYWSPDGARIAFTRDNAVYVVNADGTGLRRISVDKRLAGPWSPDGRYILVTVLEEICNFYYCYYYGSTVTPSQLRVLELETGKEVALTNTPGVAKWSPVWSADGQRIYFISAPIGNSDIYMVGLAGGTATNLTNSQEQENWISVATVPPGGGSAGLAGIRRR